MQRLSKDGETVVLTRFRLPHKVATAQPGARLVRAAVVDTETTGIEALTSEVIEIAILPFDLDVLTGKVVKVYEGYQGLQEPTEPLSPEISEITGLQTADLRGKEIDWQKVYDILKSCACVFAHHANFDRKQVEVSILRWDAQKAKAPDWVHMIWGCTLEGINWDYLKPPAKKLSVLCWLHGFYFDAHRAMNDVEATLNLLIESGRMQELYATTMLPSYEIWAHGSPYESKDRLRSRKYKWAADSKCWMKSGIYPFQLDEELAWLKKEVYGGLPMDRVRTVRLDNWQRYK